MKLLDFGLAKQNTSDVSSEETETLTVTQAGVIMGTPAYMSPEQAEGKEADARSDIFSFGGILYEMLAVKRALAGGSAVSLLGAILHQDPEPLDAPPAVGVIVRKCLAKSPDAHSICLGVAASCGRCLPFQSVALAVVAGIAAALATASLLIFVSPHLQQGVSD